MTQSNSYQTILRSSSIIGGASILNILVGLIRNKVVAVLLGPAGIGLIGILVNLMQMGGTLAALGFGTVGTRQIAAAAAKGEERDIARARRALFWGILGLALVGALIFFLLRNVLAAKVLREPLSGPIIGWLSLGVFLLVVSGSQRALLNGLRQIGDLARIQVGSAVFSTLLGVSAILIWGRAGIIGFILAGPIATFVLGYWFVRGIRRVNAEPNSWSDLAAEWRAMVRLGMAFVTTGILATVGELVMRSIIQRDLGAIPLGQFQAAWAISMTYISFVLSAMGTDYYPRITAVIDEPATAIRTVNEQTEVALLLAGPVLIAMMATAPWVIRFLYTSQFAPAADILRWQVMGDILKVASWPLGYVLVAAGAGRMFLVTESLAVTTLVLGTAFGQSRLGIVATGISFALMYVLYLPVVFWFARRRIGMRWTVAIKRQLTLLVGIAVIIMMLAQISQAAAATFGLICTSGLGLYGIARLRRMADVDGLPARFSELINRITRNR